MVYLQLPAKMSYRHIVLRILAAMCRSLNQGQEFLDGVISAVGESFNNAVLHAHPPSDGERTIDIEIDVDRAGIEVRIFDEGEGFAFDLVPLPVLDPDSIDAFPEGGMGLYIIRTLMSEVAYSLGPPNVLYLRKAFAPSSGAGSSAG